MKDLSLRIKLCYDDDVFRYTYGITVGLCTPPWGVHLDWGSAELTRRGDFLIVEVGPLYLCLDTRREVSL